TEPQRGETSPTLAAPLLILAAALRIAVNNVTAFSRADETVYLLYARALSAGSGFPSIIRMFAGDRGMWVLPNPLRWSYLGAAALATRIGGDATPHALAMLSTLAGIASVALTYLFGRQLFDEKIALIATTLAATSPLQLALGRRALADEFFCAAVLASLAAMHRYFRSATPRGRAAWLAAWIAMTTIAIAAKEQMLFLYPVLVAYWWMTTRVLRWRDVLAWAAPPALFFAVFCALARDVTSFFRITQIITGAMRAPYAEQYQSGPPHRLLIDSMAIAPVVTTLFLAAIVMFALRIGEWSRETRLLGFLGTGMIAVYALLPSQNLRYIVCADPAVRLTVAAFLAFELRGRPRIAVALLAINALIELQIFHQIFVTAAVYDPVTQELLHALKMLP
ncbi:MAG: glycosyltransferase family 39 protein, partial [Thermoanaerobaculia bacterium]